MWYNQSKTGELMNLLSDIISKSLEEKKVGDKKENLCALEICFYKPEMIDDFQSMIAPVAPNLKRHGDRLFSFYPSRDDAQKVANKISDILNKFDDALIETEFKPDWMEEYFKINHYGVNCAMASHNLSSPDQLGAYLVDNEKFSARMEKYTNRISSAKLASLSYSNEQMEDDFSNFILSNWEGFKDVSQVKVLMNSLINALEEDTKDNYHFSSHPAQEMMYVMRDKSEYLNSQKTVEDVRKQIAIRENFESLCKTRRETWENCRKHLSKIINKTYPGISLKGLDVLLKDEDAKIDKHEKFKGLDLGYDFESDMNNRLSPKTLRYDIQEQGRDLIECLAGGVAAYYLCVMNLKQEAKFEELLIEHSKVMDKEPFNLLEIASKSRPNTDRDEDYRPSL